MTVPIFCENDPHYRGLLFQSHITILYVIVFLFLFPFILIRLWVWVVPLLFVEAVQEGIVSESLSFGAAFRATAVLSLIFAGVAVFWESGRCKRAVGGTGALICPF